MTTLTNPASAPLTNALQLCIDCGEQMNIPDSPCTPAHCQYEGIEHLLKITFSDDDVRVIYEDFFAPSTDTEIVLRASSELLAERGLNVDAFSDISVQHIGTCRKGSLEMFDYAEEL